MCRNHLTNSQKYDTLPMTLGWLPGVSRHIDGGERVFIGDCIRSVSMHRVRGLAILAVCSRLFLLTVVMTAGMVRHG